MLKRDSRARILASALPLSLGCVVLLSACATLVSEDDARKARIHYDLGVASINNGQWRAALREFLVAVELDPALAPSHNALGLVYHTLGRPSEALEHYREAVKLKPGFSEAHNNLGVLLMDVDRYDEAIKHFKQVLADILYPTPSLAEGNMGWAYYKKGEVEVGLRHLKNSVAINPKFCRGYEWLARIGLDRGDPAQVVASCKRFEKHCVADQRILAEMPAEYLGQMRYFLGLAYLKQGDTEAAKKTLAMCAADNEEGVRSQCARSLRLLQ